MASLAGVEDVDAAKAKLDELFMRWLSLQDTQSLVQKMIGDIREGREVAMPVPASPSRHRTSHGGAPASPARTGPTPPRSPSRRGESPAAGSTPRHFTFDDVQMGSPRLDGKAEVFPHFSPEPVNQHHRRSSFESPPATTRSSLPRSASGRSGIFTPGSTLASAKSSTFGLRNGAGANRIPTFFKAGEGGRGRGQVPGDASLQSKLPAIVETWRNGHAAAREAGQPVVGSPAAGPPGGPPAQGEATEQVCGVTIASRDASVGLPVEQFAAVAKTLCGFPSFFAAPLFRRIVRQFGRGEPGEAAPTDPVAQEEAAHQGTIEQQAEVASRAVSGVIHLRAFLRYWDAEMTRFDMVSRFFRLVASLRHITPAGEPVLSVDGAPGSFRAIVASDFMPFLEELLAFHPGLAFLENTPEFQEKYARTVVARIFYSADAAGRGYITERMLRRSTVVQAFHTVDMEEDINLVNDYFSYEHFYVLYCKFWEMDEDHDFLLTREDLNKLQDITHSVLDRVFDYALARAAEYRALQRRLTGAAAPAAGDEPEAGKMTYEEFVRFFVSEEDKTSPAALRYWFHIVDVDGDGVITEADMKVFYPEQQQRMQDLGMEAVKFSDIATQMTDLLDTAKPAEFHLADFMNPTRCKLSGVFFSALFNLAKFQAFEAREAVLVKQELNLQISQWDRFAALEYMRLAEEEEEEQQQADLDAQYR